MSYIGTALYSTRMITNSANLIIYFIMLVNNFSSSFQNNFNKDF